MVSEARCLHGSSRARYNTDTPKYNPSIQDIWHTLHVRRGALCAERTCAIYVRNDGGAMALAVPAQQFLSFEGRNEVKQTLFASLFAYTASWEEEAELVGIFNQIPREPNG